MLTSSQMNPSAATVPPTAVTAAPEGMHLMRPAESDGPSRRLRQSPPASTAAVSPVAQSVGVAVETDAGMAVSPELPPGMR